MESMESYVLSDSNESNDTFDGFTSGDVALAQSNMQKRKSTYNNDAFSSNSDYSNVDSEGSISETNSELTSNDDIITSDELSPDDDVPSESESGENSDTNIPTDSDEAYDNVDVVDVYNIIGHLGEGSDMIRLLNMPINWTQDLQPIIVNPFTKAAGPNLPENFNVTTATPKDYFSLFFTEEVLSKICTNSNLYHRHCVELKHV